jgi:hypothetical protein
MRISDSFVQLNPSDESQMYPFLFKITQQWQFITGEESDDADWITQRDVTSITDARNRAIDLFNEWAFKLTGKEQFRIQSHYIEEEDTYDKTRDITLTVGTKLLFTHRCESLVAHVKTREQVIFTPFGEKEYFFETEEVQLQCMLAPPKQNEFKVLPIELVPEVNTVIH